jgi:hypothetical protein
VLFTIRISANYFPKNEKRKIGIKSGREMNDLFYVLMSIVVMVMVRTKKNKKNGKVQNGFDGKQQKKKKAKREKKERLCLMLYDLGTRVVTRLINKKKKRKDHMLYIV